MSDFIPQYKDRAPQDLEPAFTRHMLAMTAEGLHRKADIACELAWRDRRIAELEAERNSIRDKALEEAAVIVDNAPGRAIAAHEAAAQIRSLKGGKG